MDTAFDANSGAVSSESKPAAAIRLPGYGRQLLTRMRSALQPPEPGQKPSDLHVSPRAWRRNSALLMCLYENGTSCDR